MDKLGHSSTSSPPRKHAACRARRQLNVSVPAIAKLINGLERRLGVRLFERTAQGLALTANGESYLETCQPLLAELDAADELVSASTSWSSGTVAVGAQHVLAYHCLIPPLARFHALYPDIRVDLHDFNRPTEEQMRGVDVFLVLGWPRVGDLLCTGRSAPPGSSSARRRSTGPCTASRSGRKTWRGTTAY